jgi:DNA-binding response OmpR family regulator
MRVLIVEDDEAIAALVARDLRADGHAVDAVGLAEDGLNAALSTAYAAIIIDLKLPDRDGLDLVREVRRRQVHAPILILTGRRRIADRVAGLSAGADDYLMKPFAMAELRARLAALQRRPNRLTAPELAFGDVTLDRDSFEAQVAGAPLKLSRREFALLELLIQRGGHVTSKRVIEESLYGFDEEVTSNSVEVHIHNLRQALRRAGAAVEIETRRGIGYRLAETR